MLQLEILCHRDETALLSEQLEAIGALSITLSDQFDEAILEPPIGTTPLWANVILQALFASKEEAAPALHLLKDKYDHLTVYETELAEQDWERVCLRDFQPLQFGTRLWVCPSWLTPPQPEAVNLIFDPGLAFGTGTHATTALCLTWLEQAKLENQVIIDYGCGSGILALAALKLGAKKAYAVDIDDQALLATHENAKRNQLNTKQLHIAHPEPLDVKADVLIANILYSPLVSLRERFQELLRPHGKLIISGVLKEQRDALVQAYQASMTLVGEKAQDDWMLFEFVTA